MSSLEGVLAEVAAERARQLAKHGDQSHLPDGTGPEKSYSNLHRGAPPEFATFAELAQWAKDRCDAAAQSDGDGSVTFEHILTEEYLEALAESDPLKLRTELIEVAAAAVQWIQAIDTRTPAAKPALDPSLGLPDRRIGLRQRLRWIWQGATATPDLTPVSPRSLDDPAAGIIARAQDRHQKVLADEDHDPVLRYLSILEGMDPDDVLRERIAATRRQRHQELRTPQGS